MRLAIDTATRHAVVVVGRDGRVVASLVREVVPGRGTPLLSYLAEVLVEARIGMADVDAIGVGTGPGSFTGLRAGMATAKTLCWRRRHPLVSLPTDVTDRRAAALAVPTLSGPVAVVSPAGARDHYVALPDADPVLAPPATDLAGLVEGAPVAAIDPLADGPIALLAHRLVAHGHPDPRELGVAAIARMPEALLAEMEARLATGEVEDPATLVPRYVALPRGIAAAPTEVGTTVIETTHRDEAWSRTPR
jgi:tRNA threonylcarbamoyladenosine biosynthesis protein TsaB